LATGALSLKLHAHVDLINALGNAARALAESISAFLLTVSHLLAEPLLSSHHRWFLPANSRSKPRMNAAVAQ